MLRNNFNVSLVAHAISNRILKTNRPLNGSAQRVRQRSDGVEGRWPKKLLFMGRRRRAYSIERESIVFKDKLWLL